MKEMYENNFYLLNVSANNWITIKSKTIKRKI